MKSLKLFFMALCLVFFMSGSVEAASGNAKHPDETALKKVHEKSKPSEDGNKILSAMLGNWNYESHIWVNASAEPEKATGIMSNEMILGNRFISSHVSGNISIDSSLTPYKAHGLIGFDTNKQSFSSVWTDTLGTGMMVGNGKYDEKTKTIEETGKFTNPVTGLEEKFRAETKFTDDDNFERVIFSTGKSGKEAKLMQFRYSKNPMSDSKEASDPAKPE